MKSGVCVNRNLNGFVFVGRPQYGCACEWMASTSRQMAFVVVHGFVCGQAE